MVRLPKTHRYCYSKNLTNYSINLIVFFAIIFSAAILFADEDISMNTYTKNVPVNQQQTTSLTFKNIFPTQPIQIQLIEPIETTTPYYTPISVTEPIKGREIFVHWTQREISIKDAPESALWRNIPEHEFANHQNSPASASIKMQWDKTYLYVLFDVKDAHVEDSVDSWDGDSVNMIIRNTHWNMTYEQRYDINGHNTGRHEASLILKDGTTVNDDTDLDQGYFVIMKIKWSILKLTPIDGMKIPINLVHVNHDGKPGAKHDEEGVAWSKVIWDGGTAQTTQGSMYLMEKGPLMIERVSEEIQWGKLNPDYIRAEKALYYILEQQIKTTGLFQSYKQEQTAHTFDQALVLIDLAKELEILQPHQQRYRQLYIRAKRLAKKIRNLQNKDGSWYNAYDAYDGHILAKEKYTGVISWVVFALNRYGKITLDQASLESASKGIGYLKTQMRGGALFHEFKDGNIVAVTEANLGGWFAFTAMKETTAANQIKKFLLKEMWSHEEGRFYAGKNVLKGNIDKDPYLDNQTLGSYFLKTIGENNDAMRALQFAMKQFHVKERNEILGLDGRTSNLAVWLGGTFQYITAQGPYAQIFLDKLNTLQQSNGGYPHDSKDMKEPWHTTWTGISATVWAHQANLGTHPLTIARSENSRKEII